MSDVLNQFSNLPGPLKILAAAGSGTGVLAAIMSVAGSDSQKPFWRILLIGILCVGVLLALYMIFLRLRDKSKATPFASMLSRGGGGGATDAAAKARGDELRSEFEKGVAIFKTNGKDLYTLPWYVLVGPPGSGKTEAMRHSQIGFPPGLQNCLQGAGGTINMHWWLSNQAVVLDTAGRMFMQEADAGGGSEWKEFLRLLKQARPNCPINGLFLVISAETLLKDPTEKIESTAGVIARQLDAIQRTLDVRFPVYVIVTKCDKIVGFRDFFENVNSPDLQHQMLGWSNPASLDEPFKPEAVDQHLESVRQKLMKRRMALLQDPVHSRDPGARRSDEVDELFELPDNLTRIAPRLRRYLEMIFMTGAWSPKPLFLRGIYFTSSMREGQVLDTSLASVLNVDVDSLPGGRDWTKEKAYFLRDVFVAKCFREKGLVTRAANVGANLRKRKIALLGGSLAALIVLGGLSLLGLNRFQSSVAPAAKFWKGVSATDVKPQVLALYGPRKDENGKDVMGYLGISRPEGTKDDLVLRDGGKIKSRVELVRDSGEQSLEKNDPQPRVIGIKATSYAKDQVLAHRRIVERTILDPILNEAEARLQEPKAWNDAAPGALAELIRIQTYLAHKDPAEMPDGKIRHVINTDALFKYLLTDEDYKEYLKDATAIQLAVDQAYPDKYPITKLDDAVKEDQTSITALSHDRKNSISHINSALANLRESLSSINENEKSKLGYLKSIQVHLALFDEAEKQIEQFDKSGANKRPIPKKNEDLKAFLEDEKSGLQKNSETMAGEAKQIEAKLQDFAKRDLDDKVAAPGTVNGLPGTLNAAVTDRNTLVDAVYRNLRNQLPKETPDGSLKQIAELLDERPIAGVKGAAAKSCEELQGELQKVAALLLPGADDPGRRAFTVRAEAYAELQKQFAENTPPIIDGKTPLASTKDKDGKNVDGLLAKLEKGLDPAQKFEKPGAAQKLVDALQNWTPAPGAEALKNWSLAGKPGAAGDWKAWRDSAYDGANNTLNVLKRRSVYGAIVAYLQDDKNGAPKDIGKYKQKMMDRHDRRKDALPNVDMTDLKSQDDDAAYDPKALTDLADVWEIMGRYNPAASSGARPAPFGEIRETQAYRTVVRAAAAYAAGCAAHWRDVAEVRARPTADSWNDFASRIQSLSVTVVNGQLMALSNVVNEALDSIPDFAAADKDFVDKDPELTAWCISIANDRKAAAYAFAGLKKDPLEKSTKEVLAKWKELARPAGGSAPTADEARKKLLHSAQLSEYLSVYYKSDDMKDTDPSRGHVGYWCEFIKLGLARLKDSTTKLDDAVATIKQSNGLPLATRPPNDKVLTRAEVVKVAAAVGDLGAVDSNTATTEIADLKPAITALGNSTLIAKSGIEALYGKLKPVVEAITVEGFKAVIDVDKTSQRPASAGNAVAANSGYQYGALLVNGKPDDKLVWNFNDGILTEQAPRMVIPIPAESVQIALWEVVPNAAAKKPDNTIELPTEWSVLHVLLTDKDAYRNAEGWHVPAYTKNKSHYIWLRVKFPLTDIPNLKDWPASTDWPANK